MNRLSVALAAPSLFTAYGRPPSLEGAVVVAFSQSGRSPDLIAVLEEGGAQGRPTVAITNDPDSPLATAAQHVFPLRAGARDRRGGQQDLHGGVDGDSDALGCDGW